jgi:signal transduction histidine kinase
MAVAPPREFRTHAPIEQMATLGAAELTPDKLLDGTLDLLLGMGFDSARFYEVTRDRAQDQREVVVLTAEAGRDSGLLGEPYPLSTATLVVKGDGSRAAIGSADDFPGDEPKWLDDLKLRECRWIEIPVTERKRLVGVLAGDWRHEQDLSPENIADLEMVGAYLGAQLGLKPIALLDGYRRMRTELAEAAPPRDVVSAAAHYLREAFDAAAVAVFAFSWNEQNLTKVYERFDPRFEARKQSDPPASDQTYAVTDFLTGRAWTDDDWRHIVSFRSLRANSQQHVNQESNDYHAAIVGPVTSVLYGVVGTQDPRYLIRLINRATKPKVPLAREALMLESVVSDIGRDVDAAIANQRARNLERMTNVTAQPPDPVAAVADVEDVLAHECVKDFGVLCHQEESVRFALIDFRGPSLEGVTVHSASEWDSDPLYVDAATAAVGWSIARFADASYRGGRSKLAAQLRDAGFEAAWMFPIHAGQIRGALFVPLSVTPGRRAGSQKLDRPADCGFGTISLLHAYARFLGSAVERQYAAAKVDGARRALGLMGHEVRTPVAALGSAAEKVFDRAREALEVREDGTLEDVHHALHEIAQLEERFYEHQRQVKTALDLGALVAKESEGGLHLHITSTNLYGVLARAIRQVARETIDEKHHRAFSFTPSLSARRLGRIECDPDLIHHVLKNVLRNAVKYSLPPGGGKRIDIAVIGEPQATHVGIKIRNWGFGIPEERRDLIFEPWVRGDVVDEMKAIRGMGLGLFLARRILTAHGGQILYTSEPKFQDPERLAKLEGFETEFEIRIPRDLRPGTYRHVPGDPPVPRRETKKGNG